MSDRSSLLNVALIAPDTAYRRFKERCIAFASLRTPVPNSPYRRNLPALGLPSAVGAADRDYPPASSIPCTTPKTIVLATDPGCSDAIIQGPLASVQATTTCTPVTPRKPLGPSIEKAARYTIGMHVKLDMRRILRFRVRRADGSSEVRYRELDGVHLLDYDTAILFEVKCLSIDLMRDLVGKQQLDRSASILRHAYRIVRTRLVYVGYEIDRLCAGLPATDIADLDSDFGIVWISPAQIEAAAASMGMTLPYAWSDLNATYGTQTYAA